MQLVAEKFSRPENSGTESPSKDHAGTCRAPEGLMRALKHTSLVALLCLGLPVLTASIAPSKAQADERGDRILAVVDQKAETFKDQSYTAEMKIHKGGSVKKTLVFEMKMKGLQKQYINFTAPGDVAGMKILMEGPGEILMYSAEFKKVRKIAAHAQNQGFFGSHFTAEDMVLAKLSSSFSAEIIASRGNITSLKLTPKPDSEISYAYLEVDLDKSVGGAVTELRYFDSSGKMVRVQKRGDWKKVEGQAFPMQISMEDVGSGDKTVINFTDVQVNSGLTDDLFSRRTLLRG